MGVSKKVTLDKDQKYTIGYSFKNKMGISSNNFVLLELIKDGSIMYTRKLQATEATTFDYTAPATGEYTWRMRSSSIGTTTTQPLTYSLDNLSIFYTYPYTVENCDNLADGYRFGFNTQEKDDEVYGAGNLNTAEFWEYDTRIGRRWNTDPVVKVWESPYLVNGGNPMNYIDINGDDKFVCWFGGGGFGNFFKNIGNGLAGIGKGIGSGASGVAKGIGKGVSSIGKGIGNGLSSLAQVGGRSGNLYMAQKYKGDLSQRMNNPLIQSMVVGVRIASMGLYGSSSLNDITGNSEAEKQAIFSNNADKTLAILMNEFVDGSGHRIRSFDENSPITKEIKSSFTTMQFYQFFFSLYSTGAYSDGLERKQTIFTSPDNSVRIVAGIALSQYVWNNAAFFTGSLDYYYKVSGNKLLLRVRNEYSISSGITRNKNDDLHRIPFRDSPLGNTVQYFNFSIDLEDINNIIKLVK